MKKLLLIALFIVLLSSCTQLTIYSAKFSINQIVKQIEKECKEECKNDEEYSDEWCNCMDICFDMDEGASYCPTDSTKSN